MFTGIIEELGTLKQINRGLDSARLEIEAHQVVEALKTGESIAVNGVCLTVTEVYKNFLKAEVMAETLNKTNLGGLVPGDKVNLERALRLSDRLGGHLVSGHIDGVGTIASKQHYDIAILIKIMAPREVLRYIIKKGSIAVDGISLTVVDFNQNGFEVSIIPHTSKLTTLGYKGSGDTVNLEADLIGKYIERFLLERNETKSERLSLDFLSEHGFL